MQNNFLIEKIHFFHLLIPFFSHSETIIQLPIIRITADGTAFAEANNVHLQHKCQSQRPIDGIHWRIQCNEPFALKQPRVVGLLSNDAALSSQSWKQMPKKQVRLWSHVTQTDSLVDIFLNDADYQLLPMTEGSRKYSPDAEVPNPFQVLKEGMSN